MTVTEILKSVQLVIDHNGKPTAALLDMDAWEAFVSMLEDIEDGGLVRERMARWRDKEGWTRWEDFEEELETDGLSTVDPE
jgi:PHD/YefM family antitoxin component YafN of YafNO toxin-antitoxin module